MAPTTSNVVSLLGALFPVCRHFTKTSSSSAAAAAASFVRRRRHLTTLAMTRSSVTDKKAPQLESESPSVTACLSNRVTAVTGGSLPVAEENVGVASVCGRRSTNDDRTVVRRLAGDLLLVGIFDGHGGREAVDFVSSCLPKLVQYWLERTAAAAGRRNGGDDDDVGFALRRAFIDVDERLTELILHGESAEHRHRVIVQSSPAASIYGSNSGTTATVCLLRGNSALTVGHVGDSRAMLCRHNDDGLVLTSEHSPDDPLEHDRILRCSGHVTRSRSNVGRSRVNGILEMSRSIGDVRLKRFGVTAEPEIVHTQLDTASDQFLTLTTDGVHNELGNDEIIDAVQMAAAAAGGGGGAPRDAASSITDTALLYGSTDNCTALVLPLAAWNCNEDRPMSRRTVKFARAHNMFGVGR